MAEYAIMGSFVQQLHGRTCQQQDRSAAEAVGHSFPDAKGRCGEAPSSPPGDLETHQTQAFAWQQRGNPESGGSQAAAAALSGSSACRILHPRLGGYCWTLCGLPTM